MINLHGGKQGAAQNPASERMSLTAPGRGVGCPVDAKGTGGLALSILPVLALLGAILAAAAGIGKFLGGLP